MVKFNSESNKIKKIKKQLTKSKIDTQLTPRFNPDQEGWEKKEEEDIKKMKDEDKKTMLEKETTLKNEINSTKNIPHKNSIENTILNIREVFFNALEIVLKKQNPITYILSKNDRTFYFSVFLLIFGFFMLLFSNLLF